MTNLEKVLRYTRSTKSRKARLNSFYAKDAEFVATREELAQQLDNVPNQHKASFLYIPAARKAGKSYSLIGPDLTIDRNSTATEVNRDLLLSTVGNNVPRIEFDANEVKGHLVEPQMTNKERFSDPDSFTLPSPWRSNQGSPTIGNYDWPSSVADVLTNAIIISGEIEDERVNDGNVITALQDTTVAAFVRRLDGGLIPNDFSGFYIGSNALNYNLISMTNLGDNVYFVVSQGNGGGIQLTVRQTTEQYASLGSGIAVSGFMVVDEYVNLKPSDYIPTNGAAATRLAERATTPTIQKIQSGILQLKVYNNKHAAQYILSSASNTYAVFLEANVVYVRALTLSTAFFNNVINWGTYEGDINMVVKFDNGEVKLFLNGVTYTPFTNTFATDSEFGFDRFGDSSINNRDSNATYEKIALLPVLLSDEQCLQLSQL